MNDLVASNNLHSYTVLMICILPHTDVHTYIGFLLPLGWVVFIMLLLHTTLHHFLSISLDEQQSIMRYVYIKQ